MIYLPLLIWLINPVPAELEIVVDASYTEYRIEIQEQIIPKKTKIIRTQRLFGPIEITVDVIWLEGETYNCFSYTIILEPGCRHQWTFTLPRVRPKMVLC